MNLTEITPLILTYNEAPNLARTLTGVAWANRIVVLDSGSSDDTEVIAAKFLQVDFKLRDFDNHTMQWNHGLSLIQTPWVLTLDADYVCGEDLKRELSAIEPSQSVFYAPFRYCVAGRALRATLYPPRAVLFRVQDFQYVADGHTQLLDVKGAEPRFLGSPILHDDRKPVSQWFVSQIKYAELEADKLDRYPRGDLGWKDKIRKRIVFAPFLTLVYCLLLKALVLDGWRGIYYTMQRVFAELALSLALLDRIVRTRSGCSEPTDTQSPKKKHPVSYRFRVLSKRVAGRKL